MLPVAASDLTPQREAFVDHYTTPGTEAFGNGTKAAIAAGYSPQSARTQAADLRAIQSVRDAIVARLQALAMSHEEVRARLAEHAAASFEPFLRFETRKHRQVVVMRAEDAARSRENDLDQHEEYLRLVKESGGEVLPSKEDISRLNDLRRDCLRLQAAAALDPDEEVEVEAWRSVRVPVLDLEAAKTAGVLHLVKEVKTEADGTISIKLHDAQSALQHLDKMHTMLARLQAEEGQGGEGDALTSARQKLRAGAPVVVAAPGSTVNVQINQETPR